MKVYVAGALADVDDVRAVQAEVVAAGHDLALDWTRADVAVDNDDISRLATASDLAKDDLDAVLRADAVLVVMSVHEGRGMFVELGAALARVSRGDLDHLVVVGEIQHDSVFLHHPVVRRVSDVREWLTQL